MAKSNITKYYEEKFRTRLRPEAPTATEALDAIDYERGIELLDELLSIQAELDEWMNEYQSAVCWTDIPNYQRGLHTLQPIRRILNENKVFLEIDKRNFQRWQERQSHEPNIIYLRQQAI